MQGDSPQYTRGFFRFSRRALIAGLFGVAGTGCKSKPAPVSRSQIRRVVSLTPNTTETIFALNAGDRLVGRSRYCDFPPEVRSRPSVGGYVDPSMEAILALRPDLVTGARGPSGTVWVDRLERRGVRTFFPSTESIAEIRSMVTGLGRLLGSVAEAVRVEAKIDEELRRVAGKVGSRSRPRVLLVYGHAPVVVAGPGSFPDEMLQRAGAKNSVSEGGRYPTMSIEAVIAIAPDLIVDASIAAGHGSGRISKDQAGWKSVQAVQDGRVVAIEDDTLLRPGPRVGEGVVKLAHLVHPEVDL